MPTSGLTRGRTTGHYYRPIVEPITDNPPRRRAITARDADYLGWVTRAVVPHRWVWRPLLGVVRVGLPAMTR